MAGMDKNVDGMDHDLLHDCLLGELSEKLRSELLVKVHAEDIVKHIDSIFAFMVHTELDMFVVHYS